MRRALVRAATSHALVALAVLLVGAGLAAGALVGFSADTQTQTSTLAGGWLAAPTSLQAPAVRGNGATLTWTPATHDVTSQSIYGSDMGTTNSCTTAAYATAFDTGLAANATTVNDDRGSGAGGHYVCYQARSEHGSWNKTANFGVVQVGLVPTGITITSNSSGGQISNGDTIDLFFNQNVAYSSSSPITVCAFANPANRILIGDSGCGSSNDTPAIGLITGVSIPNASRTFELSTVAVSSNRVRITLNTAASGSGNRTAATGTGTFTYTGSASIIQSSLGAASVCTAANCTWAWSGAF
jgi:hypothetical protein